MDDLNDPRISAYKPQRRLLLPKPPGYRRKLSKAQRKQKALTEARAEKHIARLHLVGLTDAAVIVMGLVAAAVVVVLVVIMIIHR
jgi:hypothetical protein